MLLKLLATNDERLFPTFHPYPHTQRLSCEQRNGVESGDEFNALIGRKSSVDRTLWLLVQIQQSHEKELGLSHYVAPQARQDQGAQVLDQGPYADVNSKPVFQDRNRTQSAIVHLLVGG